MSPWLRKPKYAALQRREMPGGLWAKCPRCKNLIYQKELERTLQVCPKCGYHHRLSAPNRVAVTLDPGSFVEFDAGLTSVDPLGFTDYPEKLEEARRRTGGGAGGASGARACRGRLHGDGCAGRISHHRGRPRLLLYGRIDGLGGRRKGGPRGRARAGAAPAAGHLLRLRRGPPAGRAAAADATGENQGPR